MNASMSLKSCHSHGVRSEMDLKYGRFQLDPQSPPLFKEVNLVNMGEDREDVWTG